MTNNGPKNIVHLSEFDIETGRTKHVTIDEIVKIAKNNEKLTNITFENSNISTTGTDTGLFISFQIADQTYKLKLYE